MRRIAALGAVATLLMGTATWTAPGVTADPVAPDPGVPGPAPADVPAAPPADGPTISLTDLGSSSYIPFYINRNNAGASVTFAVPPGLTPVALKARIELPVSLRFGNLAVRQGDRTINRQLLPAQDQAEMVIPLDGVQSFGGWVNLTLAMTALPLDGYCWDQRAPVRLAGAAVSFSGAMRPPTSVADFLPSVLRKITIALPGKPTQAESAAAVQAAASVAKRNGQQPEVVLTPLPEGAAALPASADPFERQIVVREGPEKGLTLQGPALLISGPAAELADQARLLGDDALQYAVSNAAAPQTLPEPQLEGTSTTVEQIVGRGLSAEGSWPRVAVPVDQTRWGRPLGGVTVRLIGSYTPVPAEFGGEVIVSVGGGSLENAPTEYVGGGPTVARWPAEPDGTIDRTVTIPDRLLKRTTQLEVLLRIAGNPGNCGDYIPALIKIDGNSSITVGDSNPPAPQGFQSLPQALMTPRIRIGIGADAFGDTARAAQIVVGLQRASAVPLLVDVTSLDQALDSADPAILIASNGWKDKPIALPFSVDQGQVDVAGLDDKGESVRMTLDPAKGFGSLQTVFDGQRSVLIATSTGDPAQLDSLLRYLGGQPGRWQGLDGRAILSAPGAEPITVPNLPIDYSEQSASGEGSKADTWFWWAVGGVAAVAALGALVILRRAGRG